VASELLQDLGTNVVRFGLWVLRRPLAMWFVLLWGILTAIGSTSYLRANWDAALTFLTPEQMIMHLVAPGFALTASILAFCMRKESLFFVGMYFLFYVINIWRIPPPDWPVLMPVLIFNMVLWSAVLVYLVRLLRAKRLQ